MPTAGSPPRPDGSATVGLPWKPPLSSTARAKEIERLKKQMEEIQSKLALSAMRRGPLASASSLDPAAAAV